jgi:hypothetical protein
MAAALKNNWGLLMRRPMLGCFLALTALQVFAAGFGFKPGLWMTPPKASP